MTSEQAVIIFCVVLLIAAGFGAAALVRAAALGRVARNRAVGMRTRATLASDDAWRAAHAAAFTSVRRGSWATLAFGIVAVVGVLVMPGSGVSEALSAVTGVALLVGVLGGGFAGHRAARRVVRSRNEG